MDLFAIGTYCKHSSRGIQENPYWKIAYWCKLNIPPHLLVKDTCSVSDSVIQREEISNFVSIIIMVDFDAI